MSTKRLATLGIKTLDSNKRKFIIRKLQLKIDKIVEELHVLQKESKDEDSLIRLSELTHLRDILVEKLEMVQADNYLVNSTRTSSKVVPGSSVVLKTGTSKFEVSLVGEYEVDSEKHEISVHSPLGSTLLNRKRGEVIEVETPIGLKTYEILAIKK